MKAFRIAGLIALVLLVVGARLSVRSGAASSPGLAAANPPASASLAAGNDCLGCHVAGDARLEAPTAWAGGVERLSIQDCPAQAGIQEQIYYSERVLLAIDRAQAQLGDGPLPESIAARRQAGLQGYAHLLDAPLNGLAAFSSEAEVLRYDLSKVQDQLYDRLDALKVRRIVWVALGISLVLLGSLAWGYRNTLRLSGGALVGAGVRRPLWGAGAVIVVLVFLLFALPIFRVFSAPVEVASAEQQEQQAVLDDASRRATRADTALERAWMMAHVGAEWEPLDPGRAAESLEAARAAALETTQNASALWGETQAAQEAAAGASADMDTANLIAAELAAAQGRAWSVRLMAVDWLAIDEARGRDILDWAQEIALENSGAYRDLDLRAIAIEWAALDLGKAEWALKLIADPALGAWGWRELAVRSGDAQYFQRAAEVAARIQDPVVKARAFIRLAADSDQVGYLHDARAAMQGLDAAQLAFLQAEIAIAGGGQAALEAIDPAYPEALALVYISLGDSASAWQAAADIGDPYERARAQSRIAALAGDAELASRVEVPILRDRALLDVTLKTRDASLVEQIESPYYRVMADTGLGDYDAALALGETLKDAYPLVDLAVLLAGQDLDAARQAVEMMDREADKAVALRAIAVNSGEAADFERALGMALAARVRYHPLSPSIASLELARAMQPLDPGMARQAYEQAFSAAESITIK